MRIRYNEYPPNYKEICQVLKVSGVQGAIFTYGDTVYVPGGAALPNHLSQNESIHVSQQTKMGADKWWAQYLADPEFRLRQELEAYRYELRYIKKSYRREDRRILEAHIVRSLASKMYGNIVTKQQAKRLMKEGV